MTGFDRQSFSSMLEEASVILQCSSVPLVQGNVSRYSCIVWHGLMGAWHRASVKQQQQPTFKNEYWNLNNKKT